MSIAEPEDQFYGDRFGTLKDPFGHVWFIATHKEDLSEDDIRRRAAEMFQQGRWIGASLLAPAPDERRFQTFLASFRA